MSVFSSLFVKNFVDIYYSKISCPKYEFLTVRWQKTALLQALLVGGVAGLANVPFVGWLKIVFKKCGWQKNKKQWVGNECRLTLCPFSIWSVCRCPPVKICFSFSCQCLLCRVFLRLLPTVQVLAEVGDFRAETVNLPQKHHRSRNVAVSTNAPFWQTPVISSLSFKRIFNN